jgi:excisionase family DNA binding protein
MPSKRGRTTVVADRAEILTASEVAELLRVNRKTIYKAAQRNEIPHRRLGRRLIFERGSVLAWLRQDHDIATERKQR